MKYDFESIDSDELIGLFKTFIGLCLVNQYKVQEYVGMLRDLELKYIDENPMIDKVSLDAEMAIEPVKSVSISQNKPKAQEPPIPQRLYRNHAKLTCDCGSDLFYLSDLKNDHRVICSGCLTTHAI